MKTSNILIFIVPTRNDIVESLPYEERAWSLQPKKNKEGKNSGWGRRTGKLGLQR